ncbi:hypothetical protein BH11MYX1_BH11MYX1_54850 [soil metagenome]
MRSLLLGVLVASTLEACQASNHAAIDSGDPGDANSVIDAASTTDAGRDYSTDRTHFFGTSRCASLGALLCDDFESGTIDTTRWSLVGKAPVIDTMQAARGTHALHIHMLASGTSTTANGASYLKNTKLFPALKGAYYARAFIYFSHLPAGTEYAHWTAFASTTSLGEIRLSGQYQNSKSLWGAGTDSGTNMTTGTGDWTTNDNDPVGSPRAVPTGEWMCIEWMHDSTNDTTAFWWDATEHASLRTTTTKHGGNTNPYTIPDLTGVWFGWQEYQPRVNSPQEYEAWIDEIAVDTKRIGCVD